MRGTWTIYRRELAGLFVGPLAWILLCLALWFNGFWFTATLGEFQGDVTETLSFSLGGSYPFWFLMIVLPPLLTMRMISEEARGGMLEFLLTAPVSDAAVVLGKFLAATTFMTILWSVYAIYGLVLSGVGTAPDWPPLLAGILGAVLTSALFCSIGILCSSLTSTPMLALFFALVFNGIFFGLPFAGNAVGEEWIRGLVQTIDVFRHFYQSFNRGVLDTAPIVFFVAWSALFVFLAVRRVEMRRWS